jgi:hypothetical protein
MSTPIETIHNVETFLARPGRYHTSTGHQAYAVLKALTWHPRVDMGEELYFPEGSVIFAQVLGGAALTPNIEKVSWGTTEDYYEKRLRDYDNWEAAFWRELIQNARDAGATRLDMECVEGVYEDPETGDRVECMRVSAADNGGGMDYETLMSAFFRKGGTLKTVGSVGGFGDAKNLILTPWLGYEVRTQKIVARGRHEDVYPGLTRHDEPFYSGTKVTVWMPLAKTTTPEHAQFLVEESSLPHIRFTVNGKRVKGGLPKGNVVMERPIVKDGETVGQLIARHSPRARRRGVYVRSHGIYMYEMHGFSADFKGVVTVEVNAPPTDVFTTKRDSLSFGSTARADLQGLLTTLATDPRQALRKVRDKKEIIFRGTGAIEVREGRVAELAGDIATKIDLTSASRRKGTKPTLTLNKTETAQLTGQLTEALDWLVTKGKEMSEEEPVLELEPLASTFQMAVAQGQFANVDQVMGAVRLSLWQPDFYLYQNISPWKMPKALHPETMAKKYHEVLRVWTEVCRFILIQFGMFDRPFGVGWVFDTEYDPEAGESVIGALFVKHQGTDWLLLNPIYIDRLGYDPDVTFKAAGDRFKLSNPRDVEELVSLAVHEITHMQGIMSHTDAYASALTDNMKAVFRIAPVIKKIVKDAKAAVKATRAAAGPSRAEINKQAKAWGLHWKSDSGVVYVDAYTEEARLKGEQNAVEQWRFNLNQDRWDKTWDVEDTRGSVGRYKSGLSKTDAKLQAARWLIEDRGAPPAHAEPPKRQKKLIKWETSRIGSGEFLYGYDKEQQIVARLLRTDEGWLPMVKVPEGHSASKWPHEDYWEDDLAKYGAVSKEAAQEIAEKEVRRMVELAATGIPPWRFVRDDLGGQYQLEQDGNIVGEVATTEDDSGRERYMIGVMGKAVYRPDRGDLLLFEKLDDAKAEVAKRLGFGVEGAEPLKPEVVFEWEDPSSEHRGAVIYGMVGDATATAVHVWDPGRRYEPRVWDPEEKRWNKYKPQKDLATAKAAAERIYREGG